jgi:predicted phosphodiesterase
MNIVLELGILTRPVLVFGGPYSNLQATLAIKAEAMRQGIASDHCICTGDIVAYCADPLDTVKLIRDWGVSVVMGNCEESLATEAQDCGCGFAEGTACDTLSKQWFAYADARLDTSSRDWMKGLPNMIRFELAGRRVAAIHGGTDDISRFIFASTTEEDKRMQAEAVNADVILAGHCGLPFTQILDNGVVWHNAGVIGMPANDGTSDVWYSLLHPTEAGIDITHHRLDYDHHIAAASMREKGLAEGYAGALETGFWPSLEVLPSSERAATGQQLLLKKSNQALAKT